MGTLAENTDASMTYMYLYIAHLMLVGLMGIHCDVITVSEVSVAAGGSISIPCLYEECYRDNVKYLCKGNSWLSCNEVIFTDQTKPGRFCISDDRDQRIFTVTINNLTNKDKKFWCAVDRKVIDVKKRFELSVTTGMPSLYVNRQEITGSERGNVTVVCHCKNPEGAKWCRLGGTCVAAETGSIDGTAVHINTSVPNVFKVMMSELSPESSGWYFCATGDFEMPVHVTVNKLTTAGPNTPNFTGTIPTTDQHASLLTSTEPYTGQPTNSTSGESLQDENRSFAIKVMILAITLVPQLFIIPAACFGLRMIMRKKNKPEECDTTTVSQVNDPDVVYAAVAHNQHATAPTTHFTSTENPIYSNIVEKNVQQTTEPAEESVIYSTLKYSKP